jgi:hypothetical protein
MCRLEHGAGSSRSHDNSIGQATGLHSDQRADQRSSPLRVEGQGAVVRPNARPVELRLLPGPAVKVPKAVLALPRVTSTGPQDSVRRAEQHAGRDRSIPDRRPTSHCAAQPYAGGTGGKKRVAFGEQIDDAPLPRWPSEVHPLHRLRIQPPDALREDGDPGAAIPGDPVHGLPFERGVVGRIGTERIAMRQPCGSCNPESVALRIARKVSYVERRKAAQIDALKTDNTLVSTHKESKTTPGPHKKRILGDPESLDPVSGNRLEQTGERLEHPCLRIENRDAHLLGAEPNLPIRFDGDTAQRIAQQSVARAVVEARLPARGIEGNRSPSGRNPQTGTVMAQGTNIIRVEVGLPDRTHLLCPQGIR